MAKRYDRAYFERWYHDPGTRIHLRVAVERKVRLAEAMQLVEKAYQLQPDDAAIMDSMGWGYYLTGNMAG